MIDFSAFLEFLKTTPVKNFADEITPKLNSTAAEINHGDYQKWVRAFKAMPEILPAEVDLNSDIIQIGSLEQLSDADRKAVKEELGNFCPWRKGPFELFGIYIDTEWRSDFKWNRVKNHIADLKDRCVLDVGCGNGYHCFRMASQNPRAVVGIDPFLLYVCQFAVLNRYVNCSNVSVLPLPLEALPAECPVFDTVFSMGVIYHCKEPIEHIKHIYGLCADGGQVVIESLIIDQDNLYILQPTDRYAKMRNVWNIPSPKTLISWVLEAGFKNVRIVDISRTTSLEQRKTEWMAFESLEDFLDTEDSTKTVEGYPAPIRATCIAEK